MNDISDIDRELAKKSVEICLDDRIIPAWEYQILSGYTREEAMQLLRNWPEQFECDHAASIIVLNSINNLAGYPHGAKSEVEARLGASISQLDRAWFNINAAVTQRRAK